MIGDAINIATCIGFAALVTFCYTNPPADSGKLAQQEQQSVNAALAVWRRLPVEGE